MLILFSLFLDFFDFSSGLSDSLPGAPLDLANVTARNSGSGAAGGSTSPATVATFGFNGLPSLPVRGVIGVVEGERFDSTD